MYIHSVRTKKNYYYKIYFSIVVCNPSCVRGACVANDTCECQFGYDGNLCQNEGSDSIVINIFSGNFLIYI